MDGYLAGRLTLGRRRGSVRKPSPSVARRAAAQAPTGRGGRVPRLAPASRGRWHILSGIAGPAHGCVSYIRRHRRLRLGLLGCLITLPLLLGGWLWLRHSSLVAVRHVRVTGLQGPGAPAVEAALVGAARRMSTLDVHPGA